MKFAGNVDNGSRSSSLNVGDVPYSRGALTFDRPKIKWLRARGSITAACKYTIPQVKVPVCVETSCLAEVCAHRLLFYLVM